MMQALINGQWSTTWYLNTLYLVPTLGMRYELMNDVSLYTIVYILLYVQ